jgi:hypothetical protein
MATPLAFLENFKTEMTHEPHQHQSRQGAQHNLPNQRTAKVDTAPGTDNRFSPDQIPTAWALAKFHSNG